MPFSNILPTTQLVLPDGGSQTPGSGTTVIGGPLPAELTAGGYTGSGIVWYSSDNTYRYSFLIQSSRSVYTGVVDNAGVIHLTSQAAYNGTNAVFNSFGSLSAGGDIYTTGKLLGAGLILGVGTESVGIRVNSTDSYLTDNSGNVDVYKSGTVSGTTGGQTYVMTYDYFISYDRMCTFLYSVAWAVATTVAGNIQAGPIPTALWPIVPPHGAQIKGAWTGNGSVSGICQIFPANGVITVLQTTVGRTLIEGSFVYPLAKPTF